MSEPTPTMEGIERYLKSLSDDDLLAKLQQASDDLADAAENQNNTPWHEACFAGTVCYAQEACRRGLKLQNPAHP